SAHAPADGAETVFFNIGLRLQKRDSGVKVASSAVFRHAAHDFVGLFRRGGDSSTIQINGQRHVAFIGKFGSLLLDQVIQSPPFVDGHKRRKRAVAGGREKVAVYGFISAAVGNFFGGCGECGKREKDGDR